MKRAKTPKKRALSNHTNRKQDLKRTQKNLEILKKVEQN